MIKRTGTGSSAYSYFWPFIIVTAVFFASGQTTIAAPKMELSVDKLAHFAVFGMLATSIIRLKPFTNNGWRGGLVVWILVAVYGGLDEYRQSFTPGRSVEFDDWLADILGAAAAVSLYLTWPAYRKFLEWKPLAFFKKDSLTSTPV